MRAATCPPSNKNVQDFLLLRLHFQVLCQFEAEDSFSGNSLVASGVDLRARTSSSTSQCTDRCALATTEYRTEQCANCCASSYVFGSPFIRTQSARSRRIFAAVLCIQQIPATADGHRAEIEIGIFAIIRRIGFQPRF